MGLFEERRTMPGPTGQLHDIGLSCAILKRSEGIVAPKNAPDPDYSFGISKALFFSGRPRS